MTARRIVAVWLALAVCMTGNGIARELVLVPALGRGAGDVTSAALGIGIVLAVTGLGLRSLAGRRDARPGRTALAWLMLTVAFELGVGRLVDGRSWRELLENYALWRGRLWPLVLATVVAAPFLWTRGTVGRRAARPPRGRRVTRAA